MGVRLDSLTIHGLQGYYEKADITFSNGLTLIMGDNSSGKTAISRVLKAYQEDVSSKESLLELLSLGLNMGYSDARVYHEEEDKFYTMRHCVVKETETRLRNYYEIYSQEGELIYRTESHNEYILNYMGYEVIPEPNGCFPLNFKGAKVNAFIDTSLMTNSFILNGLCNIEDYEIRINNIKEAIGKLNDVKKDYTQELRYFIGEKNKRTLTPTEKLESNINSIEQKRVKLDMMYEILTYLKLKLEYLEANRLKHIINKLNSKVADISLVANKKGEIKENSNKIMVQKTKELLGKITLSDQILDKMYHSSKRSFLEKSMHILEDNLVLIEVNSENKVLDLSEKLSKFFKHSDFKLSSVSVLSAVSGTQEHSELEIQIMKIVQTVNSYNSNVKMISYLNEWKDSRTLNKIVNKLKNNLEDSQTIRSIGNELSNIGLSKSSIDINEHTKGLVDLEFIKNNLEVVENNISIMEIINETNNLIPLCPTCGKSRV